MTEKYEKQCWYCGKKDMENKGNFVQCRDCGAAFNALPASGSSPVSMVDAETGRAPRPGRDRAYEPSAFLQRRAARVRSRSSK